jgi:hypothetical protein
MATFLKTIEDSSKRISETIDVSNVYTMGVGDSLSFTKIDSKTNTNFYQNRYNSLWSMLGLYSDRNYEQLNTTYSDGGLLETALEPILEAYNTHGMVMFNISDTVYRKFIDGQNLELQIPLTGVTSATTLYSSFIDSENLKTRLTNSNCDPIALDMGFSEQNRDFTEKFGIGYDYKLGVNPKKESKLSNRELLFNSGVIYLMSNDFVDWSGSSTAKTWSQGFNVSNKYTKELSNLITPSGPNRDSIAGCLFIHSGIGFIWAKDFVDDFDWVGATGGTGTTEVTFSSNKAFLNAADVDTGMALNVTIQLNPNEFNTSINPSYIEDSIQNGSNCNVTYNTITLNDRNGNCLLVATSDEPILKIDGNYSIVDILVPIDPLGDSLDGSGILYTNA